MSFRAVLRFLILALPTLCVAVVACDEAAAPQRKSEPAADILVARQAARDRPPSFDIAAAAARARVAFRREASGFRSEGPAYDAVASASGLTVTPVSGDHRGAAITFGVASVGADGAASIDAHGAVVFARSGGVTERLRGTSDGVEQSWAFERRPAGGGDLVVRLPVTGAFLGATARGLHFGDSPAHPGVRYGLGTWIDARGARTEVRPAFESGAIVLRVPAKVIASSEFPAVLDPVVGPELGFDTAVPSVADGNPTTPAAAFDGTNFLAVWNDTRDGRAQAVIAARVTPQGVVLDANGLVLSLGALPGPSAPQPDNVIPQVAVTFGGGNYLVVYQDWRSGSGNLYATRISPGGIVLDPAGIPISTAPGGQRAPSVAFSGSEYLVVWEDARGASPDIYGARVSVAGSVLNASGFVITNNGKPDVTPRVAFGGGEYFVVWSRLSSTLPGSDGDIIAATISPNGTVTRSDLPVATGVTDQMHPNVSFGGSAFMLTYLDSPTFGFANVMVASAQLDGTLGVATQIGTETNAAGAPSPLPRGDGPLSNFFTFSPIGIGFDGTSFAIAWPDAPSQNVLVQGVTPAGAKVGGQSGTHALQGPNGAPSPVLAFDGTGFLLVFHSDSHLKPTLDGVRFTLAPSDAGATFGTPFQVSRSTNSQLAPAVAFDGTNYLVVWSDGRVLLNANHDIYGALVDPSGSVVGAPFAISLLAFDELQPRVAFDGTNYLVVWGTELSQGQIFGSRVTPAGVVGAQVQFNRGLRGYDPDVAYDGSMFVIAWSTAVLDGAAGQINGVHVLGGAGPLVLLEPSDTAISRAGSSNRHVALAPGLNREMLVTWSQDTTLVSGILRPAAPDAGAGLATQPLGSSATSGFVAPAAAFDAATGWMVAWVEPTGVFARRINGAGAISGAVINVSATATPGTRPAIGFETAAMVVIWSETHGGTQGLYAGRFGPAGGLLEPAFAVAADPAGDELAPAAAATSGNVLVTYAHFDRAAGAFRVRGRFVREVTSAPIGAPCGVTADCVSGATCVDGVCCSTACNVADPLRCTACSRAAGAASDGTCANIGGRVCRPSTGECDLTESCSGAAPTCPADQPAPDGTICSAGKCAAGVCVGPSLDAGVDAQADAATDAQADAATDAQADAASDAQADAASDAQADAAVDAARDTGADAADAAGADASSIVDAAPDAPIIVVVDAGGVTRPDASFATFPPGDPGCGCRAASDRGKTPAGLLALAAIAGAVTLRRRARLRRR